MAKHLRKRHRCCSPLHFLRNSLELEILPKRGISEQREPHRGMETGQAPADQSGEEMLQPQSPLTEGKTCSSPRMLSWKASQLPTGLGWLLVGFATSWQRDPGEQAYTWDGFGKPLAWGGPAEEKPHQFPWMGGHWKSGLSRGNDSRSRHMSFFTPEHEVIRNDKTH